MGDAGITAWKQVARYELISGWRRWASFSCIWFWSCLTFAITAEQPLIKALPGVLSCPNEVTLIAAVAMLFIILFFTDSVSSIVDSRSLMLLSGILLTSASTCFIVGVIVSAAWLLVVGMALGGAAIGFLKIAWGEMYSRMSLRQGLFCMGYALVVAMAAVFVVQHLPFPVQALILVVVSVACAYLARRGTQDLAAGSFTDEKTRGSVSFSYSLLLLPALVAFSYGMVKGVLPWIPSSGDEAVGIARSVAELAAGVLLVVFACRLGGRLGAAQIYASALILVVAGLALFLLQNTPVWVALGVHEAGFSLFYFFMVVYWGDLSRRTGMGIVRIYAIGYFAFQFFQFIGTTIGYYLLAGNETTIMAVVFMVVILAFFVVALLLLLDARSPMQAWLVAEKAPELGDEVPIACTMISSECGLSPREHEVIGFLARGRNASSIARMLCISPDTAKTHIKNIYRKLDVHTQQELIDLIEQTIRKL